MSNAESLPVSGDWPRAPATKVSASRSGISCGEAVVRASQEIGTLAAAWPAMSGLNWHENASGYPFQCRDHLEIWLETIGRAAGVDPFFVTVSDRTGNPLMMIPLGVTKRKGIRILAFLDAGVSDYNAPLLFPAADRLVHTGVAALWKAISSLAPPFDIAMLEKMPEFVGGRRNPLHDLATGQWKHSGHSILLDGSPIRDLEKKRDYDDNQRKRKRLSEIGRLEFRIAQGRSEIQDVFEIFMRQKSRRYLETLGMPGFDVPGQRDYYLTMAQRLPGRGAMLAYLKTGDTVISTAWCLLAGNRFYYMMAGYEDGFFRRFSPGKLLLEELVGWCTANGFAAFDFGIGDEAYKLRWRQTNLPLSTAMLPRTARGHAYRASLLSCQILRRTLPPGIVRFVKGLRKK